MLHKALLTTSNIAMPKLLLCSIFYKENRILRSRSQLVFPLKIRFFNTFLRGANYKYCLLSKDVNSSYSCRSFLTLAKQPVKVLNWENFSTPLPASFFKNKYRRQQHYSSKKVSFQHPGIPAQDFDSLYLLQFIRLFRFIGFSTKISTFVTTLGCPLTLGLYVSNTLGVHTALSIAGALISNSLILLGLSAMWTSRVVGKIMLSEDQKYFKISHLSIFGKRKDIYIQPQDLIVSNNKLLSFFAVKTLQFKNEPKKLLFFPFAGTESSDIETLDLIFSKNQIKKT